MRSQAPTLAPIFRSDHQLRILAQLHLYGGEWSLGELAEQADVPLSTASREVQRLTRAGLVRVRSRGQFRLVEAVPDLPWGGALRELLDQTVGPTHHLRALIAEAQWADIEEAYIFGSWARRYHGEAGPPPSDLDVLLISGEPIPAQRIIRFQRELELRVGLRVDAFAATPRAWADPDDESLSGIHDTPVVRVASLPGSTDSES